MFIGSPDCFLSHERFGHETAVNPESYKTRNGTEQNGTELEVIEGMQWTRNNGNNTQERAVLTRVSLLYCPHVSFTKLLYQPMQIAHIYPPLPPCVSSVF